jgi:L-glutamine-phosphate cytidylyltransferase
LNAIILAAGKGERLRPLTENKPKCLVKLFGKSLLEWQIETFHKLGIDDITIVTGYKSNLINFPKIINLENKKYDSTNMVETLFCAEDKLKNSTIISYGDIIFESKILSKLIKSKENFSIVVDKNWLDYWKLRFKKPLDDAESLQIDSKNFITNIGQKVKNITEIQAQYIGLMKFQNEGIPFLKSFYRQAKEKSLSGTNPLNTNITFENSYMTDLLNSLINAGCNLKAIEIQNGWLELDSIDDYKLYEQMDANNNLKPFFSIN